MSSCSPSSSAVTIPTPGKSILKRPPHSQQSLFARFTKFLPVAAPQPDDDHVKPLKRAHFILPEIAIVYPISSVNPPSTPALKDEKRAIEDKELERRRRVVRGPPSSPGAEPEGWWNMDKVASFYRECCAGYDEEPDPAISAAFKMASHTKPRTVDLSGVQLTPISASVLSDVFTIDWGLRKIVFRECDLDDLTLKPILHSLLISGSVSFLSVASNRRLKAPAFRLIGAYMKKSQALRFIDLAQNFLDKKSIEYIVAALETPPEQGLDSLRLDDCSLRPAALEALCRAVRTSSLKHISLRHNRISSSGGVALALMIRDYPDTMPILMSPTPSNSGTPVSSTTSSPSQSVIGLPPPSPLATHSHPPLPPPIPPPTKAGPVLPPPRHPSQGPVQTTYTPYIPKGRRRVNVNPPSTSTGQHIPIITSSSQGGVTTRHPVSTTMKRDGSSQHSTTSSLSTVRHDTGPSAALLDRVRALDALPRLGALKTLDLKGNDLRNGITYLAQVLKRNRTLKLLNLSENKLDVVGLVTIAEALKYNSCLETLDMSKNPCSGPSLDGIQSLRTAFTLNSSLKRLFLSSTQMTSAGAIALAEFLPESTSLLHLDLTNNSLDLAGVMALNSGLKGNHVMRCLDLNIPPADEKYAKMCREILNTCVRNTEEAEKNSKMSFSTPSSAVSETTPTSASQIIGGGVRQKKGVWGLIEDSELAKSIRKDEQKKMENDVVTRAKVCIVQLSKLMPSSPIPPPPPPPPPPSSSSSSLSSSPATPTMETPKMSTKQQSLEQWTTMSGAIIVELRKAIVLETEDSERLGDLLSVNDQLVSVLTHVGGGGGDSRRPKLVLQGLGLSIEGKGEQGVVLNEGEKKDLGVGGVGDDEFPIPVGGEVGNGDVNGIVDGGGGGDVHENGEEEEEGVEEEEEEDVETPTTPRIDKGKGRAAPEEEEEEPEKVLSPSYVIDSEDEREDGYGIPEEIVTSPTERSRSWVEEEGEIFRKGNVLLGPEELEGEYAGEDLRKELLEAMVERPPPRPILDDFGMESILGQGAPVDLVDPFSVAPGSPASHSVGGTPTVYSPTFNHAHGVVHSPTTATDQGQGQGQGQKSPLGTSTRPYVPRRSSNSIMGVMASPGGLSGSHNNNDNNNGVQASSSSSSSSSSLAAPATRSGESPNLLSQVPTFVKRKKSTDGDYFSSVT